MTDQYGNSEVETVVKIYLTKKNVKKFNWEGLADRHVSNPGNIYNIADSYYIHPGIMKNVKLDKVKLR